MPAYSPSLIRPVFVTGLKNAHALETQALAMIDRQLDRLVHYPELADRLRIHRRETKDQIRRLEEILRDLGDSPSAFKDFALNMMGNFAAMGNVMAGDEVLKNSFATYALENFEIASYISLIAMAEAGAYPTAIPLLETTLSEEKAMASWVEERLPDITRQYLGLHTTGLEASH
jgi:ferritin-like metal-binding protein YciE